MLLSSKEIKKLISKNKLKFDPLPNESDYDSDSISVRLGSSLQMWKEPGGNASLCVPLWSKNFDYNTFAKNNLCSIEPDTHKIFTIRPHTFYLASIEQEISLPPHIAMHIKRASLLLR